MLDGVKTASLGRLLLIPDIDLTGRIVSDNDDRKARSDAMRLEKLGRRLGDLYVELGRPCLTIN